MSQSVQRKRLRYFRTANDLTLLPALTLFFFIRDSELVL